MAQLLGEIEWGEALFPPVIVPEWESEAKQRFAGSSDYLRRVAPVPWLRRATLRERRTRDPVELLIALALRLAARQVGLEQAWHEGSPAARDGGSCP